MMFQKKINILTQLNKIEVISSSSILNILQESKPKEVWFSKPLDDLVSKFADRQLLNIVLIELLSSNTKIYYFTNEQQWFEVIWMKLRLDIPSCKDKQPIRLELPHPYCLIAPTAIIINPFDFHKHACYKLFSTTKEDSYYMKTEHDEYRQILGFLAMIKEGKISSPKP